MTEWRCVHVRMDLAYSYRSHEKPPGYKGPILRCNKVVCAIQAVKQGIVVPDSLPAACIACTCASTCVPVIMPQRSVMLCLGVNFHWDHCPMSMI